MSKLYEALQEAKQDKKQPWKPTLVAPPNAETLPQPPDLEPEMLALYRSLDNVFPGLEQKVILFVGAKGGEGTSTVVSNLARVAAEHLNRKVAVLDADTLHPTQHGIFGVNPSLGWDDVLRNAEPAEKALYPTNVDRLWVVPVSSTAQGTAQFIDAPGMADLLGVLRQRVDLILIDCAPFTSFPDSIALSRKADGVVLVVEAESTRSPLAVNLHQQITNAGGQVIGIVFNKRQYHIPEFLYQML